ncbi:MAG TPA: hypothetical protein DD624_04665 [Alphaproteobacteria bacterium]|nr:hypothetical protein [Alphaproteobacteria bacterium]
MTQDNRPGHKPQTTADKFAELRQILNEPVPPQNVEQPKSNTPSVVYVSGDNNNITLHGLMRQSGVKVFKNRGFSAIVSMILFFS